MLIVIDSVNLKSIPSAVIYALSKIPGPLIQNIGDLTIYLNPGIVSEAIRGQYRTVVKVDRGRANQIVEAVRDAVALPLAHDSTRFRYADSGVITVYRQAAPTATR